MLDLRPGDDCFIINSHRSRAHRAVVVWVDDVTVSARNVDKGDGPFDFDRETGEAIGEYVQVSGAVPARLAPVADPEVARLRDATVSVLRSTEFYNRIVQAAASVKREPCRENYLVLLTAVREWGEAL